MTFEEWWDGYSADRDWPWRMRGAAHEAWHIATAQRDVEIARLREALGRLLTFNISPMFDAKASYTEKKAKEWAALEWEARAALSDTADGGEE